MTLPTIKAISLHRPWANLIPAGGKRVETRHWRTNYRGPLAIHAALKRVNNDEWQGVDFERAVRWLGVSDFNTLPTGLVAVADLVADIPSEGLLADWDTAERGEAVTDHDLSFGDFSRNRYAWVLRNVRPLREPVPLRGQQALWTLPPAVVDRVLDLMEPAADTRGWIRHEAEPPMVGMQRCGRCRETLVAFGDGDIVKDAAGLTLKTLFYPEGPVTLMRKGGRSFGLTGAELAPSARPCL